MIADLSDPIARIAGPALIAGAAAMLSGTGWRAYALIVLGLCASAALAVQAGGGTGAVRGGVEPFAGFGAAVAATFAALAAFGAGATLKAEFEARAAPLALGLSALGVGAALAALVAEDQHAAATMLTIAGLATTTSTALSGGRDPRAASEAARALNVAMIAGAGIFAGGSLGGPVGIALSIAGYCAFAGVAPLHGWHAALVARAPHAMAPAAILTLRLAAFFLLARLAAQAGADREAIGWVLAGLGGASVFAGSLQAVGASDLRRLASHGFTAQLGAGLIGFGMGGADGAAGAVYVVAAGSAAATALFAGAALAHAQGAAATPVWRLDGLARSRPWAAAAITVAALGLSGAPLTAPFLGKWLLIEAALGVGWWWAAAAVIAASFAAVFVTGQLVERLYFKRGEESGAVEARAGFWLAPALATTAAGIIAFGVEGGVLLEAAKAAAAAMAGSP